MTSILEKSAKIIALVTKPENYQAGDGSTIRWHVSKNVMMTANHFFLTASVIKGVIQLFLMTAAVPSFALGTTLRNILLAIPVVLALLYTGIYTANRNIMTIAGTAKGLVKIEDSVRLCNFWVTPVIRDRQQLMIFNIIHKNFPKNNEAQRWRNSYVPNMCEYSETKSF